MKDTEAYGSQGTVIPAINSVGAIYAIKTYNSASVGNNEISTLEGMYKRLHSNESMFITRFQSMIK